MQSVQQDIIAKTINQMRKWGCQFDGKDPISFLERIEELQSSYSYTDEQMLQGLPELLRGGTLHWYRNNRSTWREWKEFIRAFREHFFPYRFEFQMKQEIQRRKQEPNEIFRQYATDLATLMRRAGGFSRRDHIDQIYENMSPDLKMHIRRENVHTLRELEARAAEIEDIERQRIAFRRDTKSTPRMPMAAALYKASECCWRCKQRGHTRRLCRNEQKKFCSQCGKDGVLTRNCHPRPGN
ncbi:activity-regulated cytoskeleton associated protein 2-like isoform X2 [Odontomachus brunneus]|uniref:activity-regulated cytoskeleton associated protein 2-like isoform X1 n=1 Tax=Odontomachus brunneus TaxID=486640 RepID=UPI0013F1BC0E|nr:activity-regulated cytoskeleton associated protein 2-like isoform X1 [Odontomachus brunneus]XP_032689775.1 activity-regulated cytoskeleton associated protein 2-like isoform X2 [Odontomachus brunneus]